MFKKLNTKTLIAVFGVLLVVVVVTQLFKSKQGDRNFESQLFTIDTSRVETIVILPKGSKDEVKLVNVNYNWTLQFKGKTYKADQSIPKGMLMELVNLRAERIAATEKSEWMQFQLSEDSATHVKLEEKGKMLADLYVGKFSFQQPNTMTTYIRLANDEKVYAVSGYMAMTFNRDPNDFRDKKLVNVNAGDITKVSFAYPADSSFALTRERNTWKVNGEPADSAKAAEFISGLSRINSYAFANDAIQPGKQVFTVIIEGNNFKPVQIKAFEADSTVKYIVTSTLNPDARFDAKNGGFMSRVFVGKGRFKKVSK